ncbi:ATP-binding cassette domain-containing protein [Endozoicomonas sp. Mp262]|uniref:ATP-binding cassette domain-containing protein n=1 Tax=Endozoicomonas sp. Mp262 TaxID=2919499 RepID=UPI0021D917F1
MNNALAISIEELKLSFNEHSCIDIPSLQIKRGETVLLFGENGSGKTTLLKLFSGLLEPDSGKIQVLGRNLGSMTRNEKDHFRADHVGYAFQSLNLIPYLTALENILLPCGFSRRKKQNIGNTGMTGEYEAYQLMAQLKMEDPARLRHKTDKLSKGLQQRIAIARALIGNPELILADEPASAMGSYSQRLVYELLVNYAKTQGATLICISHNKEANQYFDRHLNMKEINKNAETNPLW